MRSFFSHPGASVRTHGVARSIFFHPALFIGAGIFFIFLATPAHAASITFGQPDMQFFVDSSYDDSARTSVTATKILDGNHAHFYVEDSFISSLSDVGQQQLLDYTQKLSDDFDSTMYPNETLVFGNEWKPGIDNDLKIYVLITPMKNSAGGYFRPEDEQPVVQVADSNAREIVYVNAHLIARPHIHEFLAHEFQHLINYNHKDRLKGFEDEVWFNEMMSEVAPMVAGIYKEPTFSYDKSNVRDRVVTFLDSSNDDVLDWTGSIEDYGSIALLGDYLYEHYGAQLFTDLEQSDKTGVLALDEALQDVGAHKTFKQVFSDWTVATILNDCTQAPQNLYCYTDSFLNHDNLSIQFRRTQIGDSKVSFQQQTDEWAGNWFRYMQQTTDAQGASTTSPAGTYLNFSFLQQANATDFLGWYVVYNADNTKSIRAIPFSGGAAKWSVQNFGTDAKQVDVVFSTFVHTKMTTGNPSSIPYNLDATLDAKPAAATSLAVSANSINDGDLIRAAGGSKVYVVAGKYKRWIQTAAIFNSYGNLRWDGIKEVSADALAGYQDSPLVELAGDPRVFRKDADGTKHWITTEKAFMNNGYNFGMVFIINQKEFDLLRTGKNITS